MRTHPLCPLQTPWGSSQAQSQPNSQLGSVNEDLSSWGGLECMRGGVKGSLEGAMEGGGAKDDVEGGAMAAAPGPGVLAHLEAVSGGAAAKRLRPAATGLQAEAGSTHAGMTQQQQQHQQQQQQQQEYGCGQGRAGATSADAQTLGAAVPHAQDARAAAAQAEVEAVAAQVVAEEDEEAALAALQGYLTSVTAKDCGIIVTLQRVVWAGEGPEPEVGEDEVREPLPPLPPQQQEGLQSVGRATLFPPTPPLEQQHPHQQLRPQCWGPMSQQELEEWEARGGVAECAEAAAHVLRRPYSLLKLKLPGTGGQEAAWFKYKVRGCSKRPRGSSTRCVGAARGCAAPRSG